MRCDAMSWVWDGYDAMAQVGMHGRLYEHHRRHIAASTAVTLPPNPPYATTYPTRDIGLG